MGNEVHEVRAVFGEVLLLGEFLVVFSAHHQRAEPLEVGPWAGLGGRVVLVAAFLVAACLKEGKCLNKVCVLRCIIQKLNV